MPLWLVVANVGLLLVVIGVLLALGSRPVRASVRRPYWDRRHVLDSARDRARAAREALRIRGPERREALRWRTYWMAQELADYGEANDDAEMRLCAMIVKEASMSFVNPALGSPRWRLERLRDTVDFVAPYLLDEDRWWRSEKYDRVQAQVIYWDDIKWRPRARGR